MVAQSLGDANQLVAVSVGLGGYAFVQVADLFGGFVEFAAMFGNDERNVIFLLQYAGNGGNGVEVGVNDIGLAKRLKHGTERDEQ